MTQPTNRISNWRIYSRRLLVLVLGLFLAAQTWVASANATGVYNFPKPVAGDWVIDQADILSRLNEGKISDILGTLAKETGDEVHFVTIHRLDYGETVESFTDKLFKKWFPTPEAQTNQVVLVLDNVTNSSAIRTGAGLESTLTTDIAESVAQETVMVPLRQGNRYNQAFLDASDRLVAVLSGEPDPGPPVVEVSIQTEGTFATPEETKEGNALVWVIGLLLAATIIPMATYYLYLAIQS